MGRGDFAIQERKKRLEQLETALREERIVEKDKFIANLEFSTGLTRRKLLDYLQTLELAGFIFINDKEIKHMCVYEDEEPEESTTRKEEPQEG